MDDVTFGERWSHVSHVLDEALGADENALRDRGGRDPRMTWSATACLDGVGAYEAVLGCSAVCAATVGR